MDTNAKLEQLKKFNAEMSGKTHYELLGVSEEATDAEVRSAYFGLLKQYGADYFHSVTDSESRQAIEVVNRRLRVAYDAIGKAEKRAEYNEQLRSGMNSTDSAQHIDIASVFEAEQAVSISRTLMERGDFKIALAKLEKAQSLDGKSLEVSARLCYCKYMLMDVNSSGKRDVERVKETRETLEGLCDSLPNADYVRVYLGDLESLDGDKEKSLYWYKEAIKRNPDNLSAKRALMLAENRSKQKAEEPAAEPQGFLEKLKALFNKKL